MTVGTLNTQFGEGSWYCGGTAEASVPLRREAKGTQEPREGSGCASPCLPLVLTRLVPFSLPNPPCSRLCPAQSKLQAWVRH